MVGQTVIYYLNVTLLHVDSDFKPASLAVYNN